MADTYLGMNSDNELPSVQLDNGWWKTATITGNVRFTSPDGLEEISSKAYYDRIKAGEIPRTRKGSRPSSNKYPPQNSPNKRVPNQDSSISVDGIQTDQSGGIVNTITNLDLPDAKPAPASKSKTGGSATSRELAHGLAIGLITSTSILGMAVSLPELGMLEDEAKALSIPIANLIEPTQINKKYGQAIANSGDWQLAGYAGTLYLTRVARAIKARRQRGPQTSYGNGSGPVAGTNGTGANGSQNGGVFLRPSTKGLRGFTPLTGTDG